MSFKLFDQGYTAEQIKGMHKLTQAEMKAASKTVKEQKENRDNLSHVISEIVTQ